MIKAHKNGSRSATADAKRFAGIAFSPSGAMSAAWVSRQRYRLGFKDDLGSADDFAAGDMDQLATFLKSNAVEVAAIDAGSGGGGSELKLVKRLAADLGLVALSMTRATLCAEVEGFIAGSDEVPCMGCALPIVRRMLLRPWGPEEASDRRAVAILLAFHVAHHAQAARGA